MCEVGFAHLVCRTLIWLLQSQPHNWEQSRDSSSANPIQAWGSVQYLVRPHSNLADQKGIRKLVLQIDYHHLHK